MAYSMKLTLTNELRAFINGQCGDGSLYATPSEFIRDLIRQRKLQIEASRIRDAIHEGYLAAIEGRVIAYEGDLRSLLEKVDK